MNVVVWSSSQIKILTFWAFGLCMSATIQMHLKPFFILPMADQKEKLSRSSLEGIDEFRNKIRSFSDSKLEFEIGYCCKHKLEGISPESYDEIYYYFDACYNIAKIEANARGLQTLV